MHSAVVKGTKELCSVSQQEMLDLMEITDEIREHIGEHQHCQFLVVQPSVRTLLSDHASILTHPWTAGVSYPMDSDEQKQKTMDTANTV